VASVVAGPRNQWLTLQLERVAGFFRFGVVAFFLLKRTPWAVDGKVRQRRKAALQFNWDTGEISIDFEAKAQAELHARPCSRDSGHQASG
jgi:hypothetical protein